MKNLLEIAKELPGLTITLTLSDLIEFHQEVISDTKKRLEELVISETAETYPTPIQVCKILGVDRTTLWRWDKRNYLSSIEIGGKRRYRMSDIKRLLNGGRKAQ